MSSTTFLETYGSAPRGDEIVSVMQLAVLKATGIVVPNNAIDGYLTAERKLYLWSDESPAVIEEDIYATRPDLANDLDFQVGVSAAIHEGRAQV
jgi:hypothetical protein